MSMTKQERHRAEWLHDAFAYPAATGHDIDPADLAFLPAPFRSRVKRIAEGARIVFADGDQQEALLLARAAIAEIDDELGPDWAPPPAESPRDLAAQVSTGSF